MIGRRRRLLAGGDPGGDDVGAGFELRVKQHQRLAARRAGFGLRSQTPVMSCISTRVAYTACRTPMRGGGSPSAEGGSRMTSVRQPEKRPQDEHAYP